MQTPIGSSPPPVAVDLETHLIAPGLLAPPPVCGSMCNNAGPLLTTPADVADLVRQSELVIGANIAFDMGVLVAHGLLSLEEAFRAYDEGRIHDILLGQALDAIAKGHLFKDPRDGGNLRDPATGKQVGRYSLAVCSDLALGLATAKENDLYRTRYALLEGKPHHEWPELARQYPRDDARNTYDVALVQYGGSFDVTGLHPEAYDNLHDMPRQARAAWALHLASMWGYRTDPKRVEALAARIEREHDAALASFVPVGFIRPDGTEDTSAVKKAAAKAYGAGGTCKVCNGRGKVPSPKTGNPVACKEGCDGTGLDLSTAPSLPRTEKGAVSASRDTLMESGDEVLERYAMVSENDKLRATYVPFLRQGLKWPVNPRPNTLVESGRTSYSDPTQTMPRGNGVRECIVPRPGSVFCSIDYSAVELCTLAQACIHLVGKSRMAELINETGDPGSLHTAFAASMVGVPLRELKARVKAKDPAAVGYRQAAKAANFGFPGGMGASTLVLAKRKRIEGVTKSPDGEVEYAGIRFCLLIGGATRCGDEKVTEWKGKAIPPACKRCLECAEDLRSQWFLQWPEMKEYFDFVAYRVDTYGFITQIASNRVRGGVTFTSAANGYFQSLAADGAKGALYAVTRECYLDKKSPMYGARPIFFNHDEIFSEMPLSIASDAAKRMAEVMVREMRVVVPDVTVAAEPALMWRWSKDAATVYDLGGKLVPDPKTL